MLPALADMKAQVGRLVHRGFVADVGRRAAAAAARGTSPRSRTRRERLPAPRSAGTGC